MSTFHYRAGPHETVRWNGSQVQFGSFHARPEDPDFNTAGEVRSHPAVVFPRTPVRIDFEGYRSFPTDPLTTVLYNVGSPYRRESIAGEPDRCDWFHIAPALFEELLTAYAPAGPYDVDRPFSVPWVRIDARLYALQRLVTRHVGEAETPDPLFVEETAINVLAEVLRRAYGDRTAVAHDERSTRLPLAARELLSRRFTEELSLDGIASELGCSVFHLCRVFKAEIGATMHQHRLELRLAESLDRVAERGSDLSAIAVHLGFSSHSHFTATFRQHLGMTPSRFRADPAPEVARSLCRRLDMRSAS